MSDSTFSWSGGTGSASSPSNWTLENGVTNTPNIPDSDDTIFISSGDAQFTDMPLPGQYIGTDGGIVNWQGGQIDLINSGSAGGTAGILPSTFVELTNTVAAVGSLTSTGTTTLAGTIDADANSTLTYTVPSGDANNQGLIEAQNGGTLVIASSGSGTFDNSGSRYSGTGVINNGGSILVTASIGANAGYWGLGNGGTIEVNTPIPSTGTFDFLAHDDTLKLDQVNTFNGSIIFFDQDVLDLGQINLGTVVYDGNNLTLENPSGGTIAVLNAPTMFTWTTFPVNPGTYAVVNDGTTSDGGMYLSQAPNGDELLSTEQPNVACFAVGTRIATTRASVPVQDLKIGDRVHTVVGGKSEPVIWIGHRTIDCTRHAKPKQVWPIRIAAHTFGAGKPARDLFLSPDHAIYVADVLVPVKYLVNGSSIVQVPQPSVTYYHVELACHDVLLADGLAAETYLAGADRSIFANNGDAVTLYPDLSSRVWESEGCAPLVVTGPAFEAARRQVRLHPRKSHGGTDQAA